MSGEGRGKVVAVTGASGYIASWLVKLLLERGYTVKASVRDPNDPKKTEHLLSLDGARERLHLFQADLLEEGSFDTVVDGCEGVFHTASPVLFTVSDPQAELVEPAVKGTLSVLRSCAKVQPIKRIVLTSSTAAIAFNKQLKADVVVDESWFSDPSYCEEHKQWYVLSKTLAEDAAWKFTKEHGIDMVVINPGLVIGPLLQPSASFSSGVILNLVNGAESFPNAVFRWTDVRDVAKAHILGLEVPTASGRYCVVGRSTHCSEAVNILRELYPSLQLPKKSVDYPRLPFSNFKVSVEKVKNLGIEFIPLEVSLKDTVESFKEKNLVKF
ncbi:hypothetical protein M9H77_02731 [Catharanthus roseus]|uniref:Uncharacterized protein n=1 Tax=Catharanthus roseus TaxID=4058 RepID=A0ACC0C958_CATRO|nr:hypothetical protein M9H77_02731 [Catharanthus roseus]